MVSRSEDGVMYTRAHASFTDATNFHTLNLAYKMYKIKSPTKMSAITVYCCARIVLFTAMCVMIHSLGISVYFLIIFMGFCIVYND